MTVWVVMLIEKNAAVADNEYLFPRNADVVEHVDKLAEEYDGRGA